MLTIRSNTFFRAYIAASRRCDRSLQARLGSAQQASRIHKQRTGRSLRVNETIVQNEDMYEEVIDDFEERQHILASHIEDQFAKFGRLVAESFHRHKLTPVMHDSANHSPSEGNSNSLHTKSEQAVHTGHNALSLSPMHYERDDVEPMPSAVVVGREVAQCADILSDPPEWSYRQGSPESGSNRTGQYRAYSSQYETSTLSKDFSPSDLDFLPSDLLPTHFDTQRGFSPPCRLYHHPHSAVVQYPTTVPCANAPLRSNFVVPPRITAVNDGLEINNTGIACQAPSPRTPRATIDAHRPTHGSLIDRPMREELTRACSYRYNPNFRPGTAIPSPTAQALR